MKISKVIKGLLAIQEKYGNINVTVERKDMEFQNLNTIQAVRYGDSEENFVILTNNKLFTDDKKEED